MPGRGLRWRTTNSTRGRRSRAGSAGRRSPRLPSPSGLIVSTPPRGHRRRRAARTGVDHRGARVGVAPRLPRRGQRAAWRARRRRARSSSRARSYEQARTPPSPGRRGTSGVTSRARSADLYRVNHLVSCGDGRATDAARREPRRDRRPDLRARAGGSGSGRSAAVGPGDAGALHTRVADKAVEVASYLDAGALVAAAREAGADARPPRLRLPRRERDVRGGGRRRRADVGRPSARGAPPRGGQARGEADRREPRACRRSTDRRARRGRASRYW